MRKYFVPFSDIPKEGKVCELDDPLIWRKFLQDFAMDCRIRSPLCARLALFTADTGCLVRGTLTGEITVPCSRCAEDALVAVNADFENFEEFSDAGTVESESRIVYENAVPYLDMGAVCWEEFVLALPVTPLCSVNCKGLCPTCGVNLNTETCSCRSDDGDPRLAALRGLVLHNA
ncbi:MAG: DUF177 domain-containing protein [Desulfovibrio sp.]|jgi:uncharacterized protein|nr:DUF177 domain-containing protein [Desulfovibrio sp.]